MSLEGGFEEVDESFRAEANSFSKSAILANAAASCFSNSATRSASRAQFRHFPYRIFMMRQSTPYSPIVPIAIHRAVNGDAFEAQQKATKEAAARIKTEPAADKSVKAWIRIMNELTTLLAGVTDGASAKVAAPKTREMADQMEAQIKALNGQNSAAASIEKHRMEIGKSIGALGMKCAELATSENKEVSEPLEDVLAKILTLISD